MGLELLRSLRARAWGGRANRPPTSRPRLHAALRLGSWEARRLLGKRRFWMLLVPVVGFGIAVMRAGAEAASLGSGIPVSAQLALLQGLPALSLAVPGMPFVLGGSLSEDRRYGYASLVLARGVGRAGLVSAKVIGVLIAASSFSVISGALLCLAAMATAPWSADSGVSAVAAFEPGLFEKNPAAYVAMCIGLYSVVFMAMGTVATLVASAHSGRMVAETVPVIAFLGLAMGTPAPLSHLNPYARADFMSIHAPWNVAADNFAYWMIVSIAAWVLASLVYARREGV